MSVSGKKAAAGLGKLGQATDDAFPPPPPPPNPPPLNNAATVEHHPAGLDMGAWQTSDFATDS